MKTQFLKAGAMALSGALGVSAVGCYPAYPPQGRDYAGEPDAKGYAVEQERRLRRAPAWWGWIRRC